MQYIPQIGDTIKSIYFRLSDQIACFFLLLFFDKNAYSEVKLSMWLNDRRFLDNYNHWKEQLSISPAMGVSDTLCVF